MLPIKPAHGHSTSGFDYTTKHVYESGKPSTPCLPWLSSCGNDNLIYLWPPVIACFPNMQILFGSGYNALIF
jgi:hypothetical protein